MDKKAIIYYSLDNSPKMPAYNEWTYRELMVESKNLTRKIYKHLKNNTTSNPIIAVVSHDYPDYILALLAIWGVGGVYMPLDPNPEQQEDLKNRIKLAGVTALIARKSQFRPHFFDDMPNLVFLDWETLTLENDDKDISIDIKTTPDDSFLMKPAYIYCSSGTQGAPKMIENTFEGLEGRVNSTAKLLEISENSGILGYCAPEFDASLLDILMTLSCGACLYPVTRKARSEVALIEKIFAAANKSQIHITTMVVLPKILKELKNSPNYPDVFNTLKTMITMGEVCGIKVLCDWFKKIPKLKIMNGYGPTETTIAATVTELNRHAFIKWEEDKYSVNKNEYKNLLPMGNTLTGVELYFMDQEDSESSRILDEKEIKTLENGKEAQLIIGGLGIGRYLKPMDIENGEALNFYSQVDQEHFIHYDEKKDIWTYLESGNNKAEDKIRTISPKKIPFVKEKRYYLTGDKVLITAKNSINSSLNHIEKKTDINSSFDLQFLGRIDRAVKKNGVFIALDQVEKIMLSIWNEIIEDVKVVSMNENNFAAFIIPCQKTMYKLKTVEKFEKEFFKDKYQKEMSVQNSRSLPSFYFLLPHSEDKIEKMKGPQKFNELILKATRWMIPGNDEKPLDEIERRISEIWQSCLYEETESIPEFKELIKNSGNLSPYNRKSNFLYCGGDSLNLKIMIYNVWKVIKKEGNPPVSFVNEIVMNPELGVVADNIKIYELVKMHFNQLSEYPLIFLTNTDNKPEWKFLNQRGYCHVETKAKYNEKIIKIIEENIRAHFQIGPYLLLAENSHKDLMNGLAMVLAKSDLIKMEVLDLKNQNSNRIDETIMELTEDLINLSCQRKIEKWNPIPDTQEQKKINRWKFPKIPKVDIWYQSAAYSGKTSFLKAWSQKLWNEKEVWPIYFDVSGYHQKEVLDILFKKINFSYCEIEFLKAKKIILIIDHYDRMNRYDIIDFRKNSDFKNWNNLTILVASRYLQVENYLKENKYEDPFNTQLFSKKTEIITASNPNYSLRKILKEGSDYFEKIEAFKKYMLIEKNNYLQLKSIPIDLVKFFEFIQYFFHNENLKKINFEKSPWEDVQSIDSVNFHRGNPYFVIVRGLLLLSKKENKYYFPKHLQQLLQIKNLSIDLAIADTKQEQLNEDLSENNKLLTLEGLISDHPRSRFPETLSTARKPVIAFFPLTGDVPEHYYKLFDKIGNFQPWLAFAMNVKKFSATENPMESMANYYADVIIRLPKFFQPLILLGWSFGALLAFKVAEKLEKSSVQVALVINIDCPPPSYLKAVDQLTRARSIICSLAEQKGYHLTAQTIENIQSWVKDEKLTNVSALFQHIIQKLAYMGNHSFRNMLERAQINLKAYYEFKPIELTINLVVAEAKLKTNNLNEGAQFSEWKSYTGKFEVKEFDQDHFNIFDLPELANWIRQKIQDLQPNLNSVLFSERLNNYYQSIFPNQPFFVNLDGAGDAIDEKSARQPLLEYCQNFLENNSDSKLIVYGPAGSGKTTLLIETARIAIATKNLRVIYIRDSDNPKCVEEELLRAGFSSNELGEWRDMNSLVIIDGIEKFKQDINLWQLNGLDNWSNVKLILGYRYEGLKQNVNIGDPFLKESKNTAKQMYCLSMTEEQRIKLITNLSPELPLKYDIFKSNNLSEEIFSHPLILTMLSNILLENDFKAMQNSRFNFYHYFFTKQIQRSREQIDRQEGIIQDADFEKISWNYALKFTEDVWQKRLSPELMLSDPATQQARSALQAFLVKEESSFRFIHDTYFEFLFSIYLFGYLGIYQEKLLIPNNNPWHYYPICTYYSLLNFLADQFNILKSGEKFEISQFLIKSLQKNEGVDEYFSANIISFLAVVKQSFNHCEFKNISFRKANLTNAIFYQCTFEKVDFSNSIIYNNLFIECIFIEVNLDGVRIGSDYLIPIENAAGISMSPTHPNQMAYLTRQFFDCKKHCFSPQSFGIYDLHENKFIIKKQSRMSSRHFESLDFDKKGDITFVSVPNLDDMFNLNSKVLPTSLRLFKLLINSVPLYTWDNHIIEFKGEFFGNKASLAAYGQYILGDETIYQIVDREIKPVKTLEVKDYEADGVYSETEQHGILIDENDPDSKISLLACHSTSANISEVIAMSNDARQLAISWQENLIKISIYDTGTMNLSYKLDLSAKKQIKYENIVGLTFNPESFITCSAQ